MVSIDKKVFGEITLKEVIGADPPLEKFRQSLENQFQLLRQALDSGNDDDLRHKLSLQLEAEKMANRRPGSMALAQGKIKLLTDYSQRYIHEINKKLGF